MRFFFIFIFLSTIAFAKCSSCTKLHLEEIYSYEISNTEKAIALCSWWLEIEETTPIDKIHYLWARSSLHGRVEDYLSQNIDFRLINYFCDKYEYCRKEYEDMFLSN